MFLSALEQTIVAPALAAIGRSLNDFENLSWVVTAYLLSATVATPLFGKLSDIYGRRAMMLIAVAIFLLGSLACALAPTMGAADPRPRAAGFWRRRHLAVGADRDRRHPDAARAPDLPELFVGDVHDRVDPRPARRRLPHRLPALVVHLLDHAADGRGRAGDDRPRAQADPAQRPPAQARRDRRGGDGGGGGAVAARAVLGRRALSLALVRGDRAARRVGAAVARVRAAARDRAGAVHPARR